MAFLIAFIFEFAIIYAHFHIYSWLVYDGCYEGIVHYVMSLWEGFPFAAGWMFITMSIGHFGFGIYPAFSFYIGVMPFYWFMKWLVGTGAFFPCKSE